MKAERYRIIDEIGQGYYARVVRAWDRQRGSEVAIKYAKPFEDAQMKIHHEFAILSRLNHPNVVKVFDFEDWGKNPYFTSEYIPGVPITEYFKTRPMSELPNLMYQLLAGLASIHAQGYLHLDIKPDNILVILKQTYLKILDLGFAELISEKSVPSGTLGYLAPELLGQGRVDYRSDLYSIGVILYQIYTGRPPFDLKSPISTLKDQLSGNIPEPIEINPKLKPRINNLILRLLSPDPMVRPSTCHELFAEFEATFTRRRKKKKKQVALPEMSEVVFVPGIVGRDDELADFGKILPLSKRSTYALKADQGFGKSTLINHLSFKVQLERIESLKYIPSESKPSMFQKLAEHLSIEFDNHKPEDRHLVYEELFRKIKENLPFALVIDDAHSLSRSDLDLLRYIIFGFEDDDHFLLLVGGEEGDWVSIIESLKDAHFINLRPFDRNLIEEMLSRMFGVVINLHWLSSWIYQKTGGRPSAILDIINLAFRIGAMKHARGGWEYDPVRLEALESPDSLIEPTVDSLPDRLRFAVEALMVSPSPIPLTAIYLALRGEEVDIGSEFKKLWFIEEVSTPTGSAFRIRGDDLRRKMADGLAKKKRSDTAATLLKAMEKIFKGDGHDGVFTLADLSIEAHLLRKMRVYCKKAAQVAYDNFLFDRALNYFKVLKEIGEDNRIDESIGDCYWMLGEPKEALSYFDQAKESVDLLVKKSRTLASLERYDDAFAVLSVHKADEPKMLVQRGATLIGLKRFDEAEEILSQAIKLSKRRKRDRECEFKATYYLGQLFYKQNRNEEAKGTILRAVELGQAIGPNDHASALILFSSILQEIDDQDGFQQAVKEAASIIDENHLVWLKRYVLERQMRISHQKGDLLDSAKYVRELLNVMERIGDQTGIIKSLIMEGVISTYSLDIDGAISSLNRGLRLARGRDELRANCLHNMGWLYYQIYDLDKSDRLLGEAVEIHRRVGSPRFLNSTLVLQAIVKAEKGELDQAEKILNRIDEQDLNYKKAEINLDIKKGAFDKAKEVLKTSLDLDCDYVDLVELRVLESRMMASSGDLECGVEKLQGLIADLARTRNNLYYLKALLSMAEIVIKNNGYQYLAGFKESLKRIEDLIRDRGLTAIEDRVAGMREEAFDRLVARGMHPEIGRILRRLAEAVNLYMGGEGILGEILDILIDATGAERGIIFLKGQSDLRIGAGRGVDRQTIDDAREFSAGVIEKIGSQPVISNDALSDELFRERRSVRLNNIRSLIAAPLMIDKKPIGSVYLDSRITTGLFTEEHLNLLVGVTPLISTLLEKSRLFKELKETSSHALDLDALFLSTDSESMDRIYGMVDQVADSNMTVLLLGETGVGKGVVARLIHEKSRRKGKFIAVNCATLPENLFESELFGYKKGAFTDARQDKAGLIEEADQGTLFLDEVTAIPVSAQAKLLQVLEEGRFRRLGETRLRTCGTRLVCATNRDIEEEVDSGKFRKDLFYRINTFQVRIPPLRERPEDIESLAQFLVKKISRIEGKKIEGLTDDALDILSSYPWPGNIRELSNMLQRAVILAKDEWITPKEIRIEFVRPRRISKDHLINVLRDSETVEKATRSLGMSRRSIYRLMKRYDIDRKQLKDLT